MSKRIKNLFFTSLYLVLLAGSAFTGWYLAGSAPNVSREEEATASQDMLGTEAVITKTYIYRFCGHSTSESATVSREEVSMTKQELEAANPGFVAEHFEKSEAVLVRRIDGYCPLHYILRLETDALVLYRPEEYTGELIEVESNIIPTNLTDRDALEIGKVFASYNEARDYIKGHL